MTKPVFGSQDWLDYNKYMAELEKAKNAKPTRNKAEIIRTLQRRVDFIKRKIDHPELR